MVYDLIVYCILPDNRYAKIVDFFGCTDRTRQAGAARVVL